jgi:hypothetical protein
MPSVGGRGLKFKVEVDPRSAKLLIDDFEKYDKKTRADVAGAVRRNLDGMEKQMRANILVDTGLAQRSTKKTFTTSKSGTITNAYIETGVNYAVFIERMKAYFVPAVDKYMRQLIRDLKALVR